ncbi:PAS domain S-box-containing protein [Catalinimonas alkaloidigena]|uniref:histidine kinase n=1 Tax=Catalinimonas alkaloidigena TaxID=1075417 RepID=A0A1G9UAQ7_9BACT|nr:ATP-binding protein [Catalinimonas alkaloidigena]SDM57066.1 PAS domain S-box-containing protein [Catalinimonas alkaloidigena]
MDPSDFTERPIRILILEDYLSDAELLERELRKAKIVFEAQIASTQEQFMAYLREPPDLILADYTVPGFNGLEALEIVRQQYPFLPFVFTTGTLGEERAVETLQKGASDFLLKDNIHRLPFVIRRVLREAEENQARRRAQEALQKSEERYRLLAESTKDLIGLHETETFAYTWLSSSVQELLGFAPDELLGRPFAELVHPDDRPTLAKLQAHLRLHQTLPFDRLEVRMKHRDGSFRWMDKIIKLRRNGGAVQLQSHSRDITAYKQVLEKLIQTNTELENFAYITSHDLRAPVVNMQSLMRMCDRSGANHEKNLRIMEKLDHAVEQMALTLEDLTEIVEVRKGGSVYKRPVVLSELMQFVLESIEEQIRQTQATVQADFDAAPVITSNYSFLRSILQNLVTNAVRYRHPDRAPQIRIESTPASGGIYIRVADNGLGIDLARYSDRLFQLHQRFHEGTEGRGIGLYLVKKQLEVLEGHIDVESEVDVGTTFRIFLKNFA